METNAETFAKHIVQRLVESGIFADGHSAAAFDLIVNILEDEEDAGTVEFKDRPNWGNR